jgi:hypothetical protein
MRTFATNLFDEARRASWRLVLCVLVLHGLFLFLGNHESLLHLGELERQFDATAIGRVVGFGVLEAWAGLLVEVGVILLVVGRMRPREIGLRLGAIPGALFGVGGVWLSIQTILFLVGLAKNHGSIPLAGWDSARVQPYAMGPLQWALSWGLLGGVVFRGFLLTQLYLMLGKKLGDHPARRWACALLGAQLVSLVLIDIAAFDLSPTRPDWRREARRPGVAVWLAPRLDVSAYGKPFLQHQLGRACQFP